MRLSHAPQSREQISGTDSQLCGQLHPHTEDLQLADMGLVEGRRREDTRGDNGLAACELCQEASAVRRHRARMRAWRDRPASITVL